jgi:hypothetical protein
VVLIRRLVAAALFAATLIAGWMFASRNGALVDVDVLVVQVPEVRLWLVLVVAFAAGLLIAGAVGMFSLARARMVSRRYRKMVAGLQSEVHELRNLPLAPGDGPSPEAALGEAVGSTGMGA